MAQSCGDPQVPRSAIKKVPCVAIMIGGFNIGSRDSAQETFNGVQKVVQVVKEKFDTSTKIVLLSILPRNSKVLFKDIYEVNGALAAQSNVAGYTFIDLTNSFWDSSGQKVVDSMFESDKFIPSLAGLNVIKSKLAKDHMFFKCIIILW